MGKNKEKSQLDDSDELDYEQNIKQDQGVNFEEEKASLKKEDVPKLLSKHIHKKRQNKRNWGIIIFTMIMPIQAYILEYFVFFERLKEDDGTYGFSYYSNIAFMIFICIMNFQTYHKCVTLKSKPLQRDYPLNVNNTLDIQYKNDKMCDSCKKWKPIRTSHCSKCGECVVKMDHHCPWIDNCVGQNNHQSFLLFTTYMAIGATQYAIHSFKYTRFLMDQESFFGPHFILFYVYWVVVSFIIIPMALMLFGLSIFHSVSLTNNMTTLMSMQGIRHSNPLKVDQQPKENQRGLQNYINIWDLGIIANIAEFFKNDRFFFWIGQETSLYNEGTVMKSNPPVKVEDMIMYQKESIQAQNLYQKVDTNQILEQFEQNYNSQIEKYQGKQCFFGEQQLVLD